MALRHPRLLPTLLVFSAQTRRCRDFFVIITFQGSGCFVKTGLGGERREEETLMNERRVCFVLLFASAVLLIKQLSSLIPVGDCVALRCCFPKIFVWRSRKGRWGCSSRSNAFSAVLLLYYTVALLLYIPKEEEETPIIGMGWDGGVSSLSDFPVLLLYNVYAY